MCTTSTSAADQQQRVIGSLVMYISTAATKVVPWYLQKMPAAYFRQVSPARREAHLRVITAFNSQGIRVPELQLRDVSDKGYTFIHDMGGHGNAKGSTMNERPSTSLRPE